jgi:hypothetical protein
MEEWNVGMLECWNVGMLGVRAEINHFNCKKLLQTHYSITPSFHYSNCERSKLTCKWNLFELVGY